VSVAKAVDRCSPRSVNRSWAPGCGRSLRTITRMPCGQPTDRDLGARHGGAIASQLAPVLWHTGTDQVGCAVSTTVS
jgi:hypothetical protein